MANYVNLLDIVYPVGSMYFSSNAVSPSSSIGGTWVKITNCILAASGSDYTGELNAFSGDKKLKKTQMPEHQHMLSFINKEDITKLDKGEELFSGTIVDNYYTEDNKNKMETVCSYWYNYNGNKTVTDGMLLYNSGMDGTTSGWVTPLYATKLLCNARNGGGRISLHITMRWQYGEELPRFLFRVDVNE